MNIYITNKQQDLRINKKDIEKVIKALSKCHGALFDELSIHFVSSLKIKELHKILFNDPSITDCITCPIDPPGMKPYCLLGEVFVCPQVAIDYAKEHATDPLKETILYVIHGFLHLLGYDDLSAEDQKIMRQKEKDSLDYLNKEGLC
jgi:probable rRNA maturation factor